MPSEHVRKFYSAHSQDEWDRMFKSPYTRLEFDTTLHFLDKYLPSGGSVLDAGAGPGRYSVELAKRGYKVTVQDLAQANLDFAREKLSEAGLSRRVREFVQGSIESLPMPEESFDAVLCAGGPISHIMEERNRRKAVSELVRVAKAGAPIIISVINKFSALIYEGRGKYLLSKPDGSRLFRKLIYDGDHTGKYIFTAFHGFLPEELLKLVSGLDAKVVEMAGLEGLGAHHPAEMNKLSQDKKLWKLWLEAHYETCTHPAVQAMSEHMLMVLKKTRR